MPVWSLKRRILLINASVLALAVALLGVYFINTQETMLTRQLIDRGLSSTRQLALLSELATQQSNAESALQSLADTVLEERMVRSVRIFIADQNLEIRAGPGMLSATHELAEQGFGTVITETEASLRFVKAIVVERDGGLRSQQLGWVELEYADHPLILSMFKSVLVAGLIVFSLLIAVMVTALFLTSRYNRKFEKLLHAVDQSTTESTTHEILLDGSKDELELLAIKLNNMWRNLYALRRESEQNAAQTTRDLRETLETLEVRNIELDLARKEAVKASHVKSEFLANTSHEIRTPLHGIIGFTNVMMKTPLSNEQLDHVRTIRQSATGLLSIINDILDFSKLEAGKLVLDYIAINLFDLLEETTTLMAPVVGDKNITLSIAYQHDVPEYITGDPQRLQQVMTNLVHNAIKFTDAGQVQIGVRRLDNGELELSVSDTGIGISDEQQRNLFSAFSQGDRSVSRNYGGTGLGLVIAQRLVEQMGSQITLTSTVGEGSTFRFSLATKPVPQQHSITNFDRLRVCYKHQNSGLRQALQQLFSRWKIDAVCAETYQRLEEVCAEEQSDQVDVLVLGCTEADLNNQESCQLLQKLVARHHTALLCAREMQNQVQASFAGQQPTLIDVPLRRQDLHDCLDLYQRSDAAALSGDLTLATSNQNKPSKRLLVVDDNVDNLKLLRIMLEHEGLACLPLASGAEAIAHCDQEEFEVILMDVQMPKMSGLEAAQTIRTQSLLNRSTPIIAVTAHAHTEDYNAFLRAGMNDYLAKPIMEEQLSSLLTKWMHQAYTAKDSRSIASAGNGLANGEHAMVNAPVDLNMCHQLAGRKPEIAQEMLTNLLNSLPSERKRIMQHRSNRDSRSFADAVHYLHGLACYTGVPTLRDLCKDIQTQVKNDRVDQAYTLADSLDMEIDRLLDWRDRHDIAVLFET